MFRKPPDKRRDRTDEFASLKPWVRTDIRMATPRDLGARVVDPALQVSRDARTRMDLRASARGEQCLIALPDCPRDPAQTILSHARWGLAGKGAGIKAVDLATAYGCTSCDGAFDGQRPPPSGWTREMVDHSWLMAHLQTLVRFVAKGLI